MEKTYKFTEEEVEQLLFCIGIADHEFGKTEKRNHVRNILLNRRGGKQHDDEVEE